MKRIISICPQSLDSPVFITTISPDEQIPIEAVLILLHGSLHPEGSFSAYEKLPEELHLQELCNKYHMMITVPFIKKNNYYIGNIQNNYDIFISEELPCILHSEYPLTRGRELLLGGISMGGYGAVLIGTHTGIFKKIISVSGAFIQNDIKNGSQYIWGHYTPKTIHNTDSFLRYCLPLNDLEAAKNWNVLSSINAFPENAKMITFAISCGTNDLLLYPENKRFIRRLEDAEIKPAFFPLEGGKHDSSCFREGLDVCLDYILSKI